MALVDALRKPVIERVGATAVGAARAPSINRLLAPRVIDERRDMLNVGDSWYVFLEARDVPVAMSMAWMSGIAELDRPDVIVWWMIDAVPDAVAQRILTTSESAARDTMTAESGTTGAHDIQASQGYEAVIALRRAIAAGHERMVRFGLVVAVAGANEADARARAQRVRMAAAAASCALEPIPFEQYQAYVLLLNGWTRPQDPAPHALMDTTSSVATTFAPVWHAAPRQARRRMPLVWGVHVRTNEPIVWDRSTAVNPHALIVASSGSGKTYAMRGLIAQEWALSGSGDHDILIIDPKFREYRNLVLSLEGQYVSLDAGVALNPLDLPRRPPTTSGDHSLSDRLVTQRATVVRAMIVHELHAHHFSVGPAGSMAVERAILAAYAERGITDEHPYVDRDDRIPLLSDVQRHVRSEDPHLADQLSLFTEGAVGQLLNRPSAIDVHERLVGLDLSSVLASDDPMLARILSSATMIWVMTRALSSARRVHVVLDEAHVLLHHAASLRVLELLFRVGRSLGVQVTVITQSMSDVSEGFAAIMNENAATKLLLGVGANAARAVAEALNLQPSAAEYLAWCRLTPGVGSYALLLTEQQATPILIRPWAGLLHDVAIGRLIDYSAGANP